MEERRGRIVKEAGGGGGSADDGTTSTPKDERALSNFDGDF